MDWWNAAVLLFVACLAAGIVVYAMRAAQNVYPVEDEDEL